LLPNSFRWLLLRQDRWAIIEVQDPPLAGSLATQERMIRPAQEFVRVDL
jgi:hypothetical protein